MSYQVLARKWRPQDFDSLVGQDHVVTALRNALSDGRIAQAYLFSGIRGVGKTTAARVLAKALNCLSGPDGGPAPDPCNECDSCVEINRGGTMDVLEVDAATYSKVEQVRELTETLRYAPARGRYKVVVLDEVHRLSRQAFDALLKIVEEPPPHLVFIFATTEIDAVPATILSRCQEFQFRRVASPVLAAHLRRICDAEEITASDAALRLIARAGEGSVRDSVALLDQMSTFGHGTISDDDAAQLLAGFDAALFGRLLGAILQGDAPEVSAVAREVESNGWDPHHVFGQFLGFCRDGLHLAMGGDDSEVGGGVDLPAEEAKTLADMVRTRPGSYQGLLQVLQLLLSSEATVKRSEFGNVALEIAWLRAAELPRVQQIEALLSGAESSSPGPSRTGPRGGGGSGSSGPRGNPGRGNPSRGRTAGSSRRASQAASPEALPSTTSETTPKPKNTAQQESTETPAETQPQPAKDEAPAQPAGDLDASRLGAVLELLPPSFAGPLRGTRLGLRDGGLVIVLEKHERLVNNALSRKRNADALESALRQVYGPGVGWSRDSSTEGLDEYVFESPPAPVVRETPRPARAAAAERSNGSGPPHRSAPRPSPDGGSSEADQPPVDLYDRGGSAETAELDFSSPNGSSPRSASNGSNGSSAQEKQRNQGKRRNGADGRRSSRRPDLSPEALAAVEGLPTVRLVQDLFRGKIRSVRDEISQDEMSQSA